MPSTDLQDLARLHGRVRAATEALAAPLSAEDQMVQSMPLASPTKWHLAHTSWYFETFVLAPYLPEHRPVFAGGMSDRLWNSYYQTIAPPPERTLRSTLSRPSLAEVLDYRHQVDAAVRRLCEQPLSREAVDLLVLGVNHEEQHQELILTDIKHAFSLQPLRPGYLPAPDARRPQLPEMLGTAPRQRWHSYAGGVISIGHEGGGFSFDNECPRHRVLLEPFALAHRAVTCGEYLEFIDDGGYRRPELWLSDGWAAARAGGWQAPLYWEHDEGTGSGFRHLTLAGMRDVAEDEPVCHVSYFEADAFARWAGARLPREEEWEHAAAQAEHPKANLLEQGALHPMAAPAGDGAHPVQMLGDVWEWTQSAYLGYPGYRQAEGALGEYNGKFMSGQLVLRGGSCVTPRRHLRVSYRNFFPPDARWQFTGIRLARDEVAGSGGTFPSRP
jgi:ergothioneine biosynthesis protein EgtB